MHFATPVYYRQQDLMLEEVSLQQLAQQFGTPCYVYSRLAIMQSCQHYQSALQGTNNQLCFAVKACPNIAILQLFAQQGLGFDIVSSGELSRVLAAGGKAEQVYFSGVGKSTAEIEAALKAGIGCFNIESESELERINAIAERLQCRAPIALRVNPDVDAKTHPYISTGLKNSKFGIAHERVICFYQKAHQLPHIAIEGISCHIGSQILENNALVDAAKKLLELITQLEQQGISLKHIDLGGGIGIHYQQEAELNLDAFLQPILAVFSNRKEKLILAPGRSLIGNAGVLLTQVEYLKHTPQGKNFAIVNAGMNDLLRPALYQAYHQIVEVRRKAQSVAENYDVVGPVCESSDCLGYDRNLCIQQDDVLAILSAGAYGMSMSSHYNSRTLPAEVLISAGEAYLIRQRETYSDLFAKERLVHIS